MKGRVALITGSTGGIGFVTAKALAAGGCNIMLNGLADAGQARERVAELERDFGVAADFNGANLRDPRSIDALVKSTAERFGSIDILINNAAVRHFGPIEQFQTEDWQDSIDVNLSAPFYAIRAALPLMRKQNWGRIINMASALSFFAQADRADYITTKTGLVGLTRAVALEVAKTEITCNAVCPGTVLTEGMNVRVEEVMTRDNLSREAAVAKFMQGRSPSGRFIKQESVAGLIVYLCGPLSGDINGASLSIDAAWLAGR
jgi:3-hydroxybutyrate dehydrogenase